jgi:hypothetical protein
MTSTLSGLIPSFDYPPQCISYCLEAIKYLLLPSVQSF